MMPNSRERVDKAARIARILCMGCMSHICDKCWVHWLINSIAEGKDIEEPERET